MLSDEFLNNWDAIVEEIARDLQDEPSPSEQEG